MRRSRATAALLAAFLALAACANAADETTTIRITPSPALAEAIANGEMTMPPAFTATPVDSSLNNIDSGSSDSSTSAATTAPVATTAPASTVAPKPAAPTPSSTAEVAVDTFKTSQSLANGKSSSSGAVLGGLLGVGAVAAIVVAVMYKRKSRRESEEDEPRPQQNSRSTTCSFENADYTPGKQSLDGMLQDDRAMAESIAMMPVFSAADRMDMSGGIVRLSSPFGASGARISSPGRRVTEDIAFNVGPGSQRSAGALDTRSTGSSTAHSIVHVKPEAWL